MYEQHRLERQRDFFGTDFFQSIIIEQRGATEELRAISRELQTILDDILAVRPELGAAYQELLVVQAHAEPDHALPDTRQTRVPPHEMDAAQLKREAERNLLKSRELVGEAVQLRVRSKALRAALRGATTLDRAKPATGTNSPGAADGLSRRELQVLHLMVKGQSSKKIAAALGISFKTAVTHRASIMSKMGVHEIASVVREAICRGLV